MSCIKDTEVNIALYNVGITSFPYNIMKLYDIEVSFI